jgi:hypothetical protein
VRFSAPSFGEALLPFFFRGTVERGTWNALVEDQWLLVIPIYSTISSKELE